MIQVVAIGVDNYIIYTTPDKDQWVVQKGSCIIYEGCSAPPPRVFLDLTNEPAMMQVVVLTEDQIKELLENE